MSKADPSGPAPGGRRRGKLVLAAILLMAAGGGFALGMAKAPLLAPDETPGAAELVELSAGTFALPGQGGKLQFVEVTVSIRPEEAPDGAVPLHDAVLLLLAEASDLPLVQDGRNSLPELEKVVMAMAPASAPWLAALHLAPSDGRSRAVAATEAAGGH
ncbi:hypothetical protein [Tabrizicola sp.]|uniref:hypothetical protein n=1 Tax=Tabrizicola sp. TaxID=2005166 RepID=UPI0035B2A42B